MPTSKPRMTITFEPAVYRALTAFAQATGTPKGHFIGQVLAQSLPTLEKLAVLAQAAKRATPEGLQVIAGNVARMERKVISAYGSVTAASDLFLDPPAPASKSAVGASRRAAGGLRADSPPSNRGSQKPERGGEGGSKTGKVVRLRGRR